MVDKKKFTDVQKHATEKATLFDLKEKFEASLSAMSNSLSSYHTERYISPEEIPTDINLADRILERFYNQINKQIDRTTENEEKSHSPKPHVNNIFDLVMHHRDKIDDAIDFCRNPGKLDSRNDFRSTKRALEGIKDSLISIYDELEQDTGVEKGKGFEIYHKRALLVRDFVENYNKLVKYTEEGPIDPLSLPETLDSLKETLLALPSPEKHVDQTPENPDSTEEENPSVNLPETGERFAIGSDQDLALFNVHIHRLVTQEVSNYKLACYKTPLELRIKYNSCVMQIVKDADTECASLNKQYEIARLNCMSHYPMVTRSDKIIEQMFDKAEQMHATINEEGEYIVDSESAKNAAKEYIETIHYTQMANPKALPNIEQSTGEEEAKEAMSDFIQKLSSQDMLALPESELLLIGDGNDDLNQGE